MAERETLEPAEDHNGSNTAFPRPGTNSRSSSFRNHSHRLSFVPSNHQHRQSFTESLRSAPTSPRSRRQPSLTQSAIQSLIDNPPARNHANPAFADRDWRQISLRELVRPDDLQFVDLDTGIEDATNVRKWCDLTTQRGQSANSMNLDPDRQWRGRAVDPRAPAEQVCGGHI